MTSKDGFISEVFYTGNDKWAFQRVGNDWNLYDQYGDFVRTFRSFKAMIFYLEEVEE